MTRRARFCCVHELENLIYRSAIIAQGDTILLKDLPEEMRDAERRSSEFSVQGSELQITSRQTPPLASAPTLNTEL